MSNLKITLRQKEILLIICEKCKYITISAIALKIGVSGRTVLRELNEIEEWLKTIGLGLEKKAGFGVRINGDLEDCNYIIDMLNDEKEIKVYNQKERQVILLSELLQNQAPIKLYYLSKLLHVTEGTISHDLDKVYMWLKNNSLELIRKPGLGVYIEGEEKSIRKAIVNLIYENVSETQLMNLIKDNLSTIDGSSRSETTNNRLLNLVDREIILKLEALILEMESNTGYKLTDNAYVGLIVHLALAIQRIKKDEKITIEKFFLEELSKFEEYKVAEGLAVNISKIFNISIPKEEIAYITMHIRGVKNITMQYRGQRSFIGNFELVRLSKKMIKIVEAQTGCFLSQNEKLLLGLVNHLGPSINRMKMGMNIRNPILEEIKEAYPHLFKISIKAAEVIEKHIGIKMPEAEIGYIAMHFGAAIEKKEVSFRKTYNAVVTCATGMGSSALLATRIEKVYDNIKVVDIISALHIEEKTLREKNIDFIISTVEINSISLPVIKVNPLLLKKDKERLDEFIEEFKNKNFSYSFKKEQSINLKDRLSSLKIYIDAIIQILNNFFIIESNDIDDVDSMIEKVGSTITKTQEENSVLQEALREREKKGGTLLTGEGIILLHSKTKAVKSLQFGVLRLSESVRYVSNDNEEEDINLAIIMLAPEGCNKGFIEVMSYISKMIIESSYFLNLLRKGEKEETEGELEKILNEFYTSK